MRKMDKSALALDSAARVVKKAVYPLAMYSGYGAAWLILIMSLLTVIDILARLFFKSPITGMMELQQFMFLIVIASSLAYTAARGDHISVEIFTGFLSRKAHTFLKVLFALLSLTFLIVTGWQLMVKGIQVYVSGEKTMVLDIPVWPFYGVLFIGMMLFGMIVAETLCLKLSDLMRTYKKPWFSVLLIAIITGAIFILVPIIHAIGFSPKPLAFGAVGVGLLMVTIFLGCPIAMAMGLLGMLGSWFMRDFNCAMSVLQISVYQSTSNYTFTVLPLFVGMGLICFFAGISKDLFGAFHKLFGAVPGGLAIATIGSCAGFAAICGDSVAGAAAMTSVALPEMRRKKYRLSLASGCIAAGGTLGILIPPSMGFIIYGFITEQSIGKLFMAGVIPGLLLAGSFMVIIYLACKHDPTAGPAGPKTTVVEKIVAFRDTVPITTLILLVLGGMYQGVFTSTEGGAIGLFGAVVLGIILRRITLSGIKQALLETTNVTSMIFIILICVNIFNYFMSMSELPLLLTRFLTKLTLEPCLFMIAVTLFYLILGAFMNIIPMMMLTLPILFPTVVSLGFDPIWFGVVIVLLMEMGMITPPMGMNVFVIGGFAKDIPMQTVFKGVVPFLLMEIIVVIILYLFPEIALWLPGTMGGLAALPE